MPRASSQSSWIGKIGACVKDSLDGYFCITERGSTIGTEIRAGTAAFLTMSYLLLVNPQIMNQAGVSHSNAVMGTALSSAVASIVVGVGGNLPFGLAPGLGLSAYLTYGLVLADVATLSEALTACFASGALLFVCAVSGIANIVMRIVPKSIKMAIVVGMGILIAMIGMVSIQLIVADEKTLVAMGDLSQWTMQLSLLGVMLIASLMYHNVQGAILVGITILTLIFWTINKSWPSYFFEIPNWDGVQYIDVSVMWRWEKAGTIYTAVFTFLFICIFDVSGVMFGLATLSGLLQEDGSIKRAIWGFLGSSAGTLVAAFFGSTPIICTVECAAGIKEGGRTGLTAVVIGIYFLLSLFLAPLFGAVPDGATAPVLILVGTLMMGEAAKIDWEVMDSAVPAFLVLTLIPLTYSITNGIVFGLMSAAVFYITTGNAFCDIARLVKGTNDGESRELRRSLFDENANRESEVSVFMSERYAKPPYGAVVV
jgi:AGZA family xanthine/uracil permease-like MFS transporter